MAKRRSSSKKPVKKEDKLSQNLTKTLLQFMEGRRYSPLEPQELFERLSLPPTLHALCNEIIQKLSEEGLIEIREKKLSLKKPRADVITGLIKVHPRGFGFVIPDHPAECPHDVFIPKHLVDNAVDGDHVEVEINPNSQSEKGPEGRVVAVLRRGRTHLGGTIRSISSKGEISVHAPLLGTAKEVIVRAGKESSLKVGDRIIMKVDEWGDENKPTLCEMSHLIGHISDPSCDNAAAIEEFDLSSSFSDAAIQEAKSFGVEVTPKDHKSRTDLTGTTCFTIDPETAKDYDDALSLTLDSKGIYHLGVHIADVAHYVPNMSALDIEAKIRCNSTYFPGFCLPMLPEELSNQLCSLRADVERLTVSVLMDFDREGTLQNYKIVRAIIKSEKRFTYEEAKEVLDGKLESKHKKSLELMVELCQLLKKKRYERGSIDFSLPDFVIEIDKKGEPFGIKRVEYDITHQLVEEFMLKANEVVATHLSKHGKPVLYRIHEDPSEENIQDFYALARSLGFTLPPKPETKDVQKLFEEAKQTSFSQQLSVAFIRSMKLAYYSPENIGHFGLALEYYCHFTSPIRRYTDLVTQRVLFGEESPDIDMQKIALKCSDQERVSFRAESSVKLLKKLRLLDKYMKADPERIYTAQITRLKPFGFFFEMADLMLEGFLHISDLEDDFFQFDPKKNLLIGKTSGKRHFSGESIQVRATSINLITLETTWELVSSRARRKKRSPPLEREDKKR
ncbi:MAG: VacB/RNase II family 3'-5' exoribonuclease [Chlamydiales bacterium]|nr:VacB/RNase II family 3'-5' exoribonuclease [Chlamydiales bacterium]